MQKKLTKFSALAQIPTVAILFTTDFVVNIASWFGMSVVRLFDFLTGTDVERMKWHNVQYSCPAIVSETERDMIDSEATLKQSDYPIKPDELIALCKDVIAQEFGCHKPSMLAENFQFVAPVIGPLSKHEFVKAFSGFDVKTAFPDQKSNMFGFVVDPQEPNRVWFISRATSTHTGPLKFGGKVIPPTNISVISPPQALSMLFDAEGKCYTLTVGYSMDRRIGNTGGLGGLFGPLYAVGHGLPIPEGRPWAPSLRLQALERVQKAALAFGYEM